MHVAIITAGGAGMFCGSCMHDNAWARALRHAGVEVSLIPLYTPLTLDEENLAESRIYLGGINVYLHSRYRWWQSLPRFVKRVVDSPGLLRWATRHGVSSDASELGELTIATLAGSDGPLKSAINDLRSHISQLKPDVVCFSNVMIAVALRGIRSAFTGPAIGVLQGDDVFLDGLIEPYRSRSLDLIRGHMGEFDGFISHSEYNRQHMANMLQFDPSRCRLLPLAIDCDLHTGHPHPRGKAPPTIGYFARIAPEKGLLQLVDAAVALQQRIPDLHLIAGGYLGAAYRDYYDEVCRRAAPLGERFKYLGSPSSHAEKVAIIQSSHVFSVPTPYQEPKGLYVLEANANGVPVVQPRHGSFPELIESTGGGLLVEPDNQSALCDGLERLLLNDEERLALGREGHRRVRQTHHIPLLAEQTRTLFGEWQKS
ncbi:MAG: glycosyltransferase family 4 protein [Planctomycetaceae bacterium]|nr:glycosyltransferase family 4 protein [Planctomycetaceae bacterium]